MKKYRVVDREKFERFSLIVEIAVGTICASLIFLVIYWVYCILYAYYM